MSLIIEAVVRSGDVEKQAEFSFESDATYERYNRQQITEDLYIHLESEEKMLLFYFDTSESKQKWIEENLTLVKSAVSV